MVSVVVPTYNERDNLPELIKRIDSSLQSLGYSYEILVVDDNSPDETWIIACEYSSNYPVRVIRRKNRRGLATAVLRGIKESSYEIIVVMDAGLQHPPEKIPELVSEIRDGVDIAIGSPFAKGGSVGGFSFFGRVISKGVDFFARTIFRDLREINDIQSGFFAFRKDVIRDSDLSPKGYKILLEILVQANYNKVSEVGYEFGKQKVGESKLGVTNIINYLQHLFSLSWRAGELSRLLKFCVVGGTGAIVNLAILYFLTTSGLFYYLISGAIAIEAGLLFNFFINKAWTFKDSGVRGLKLATRALYRDHLVRSGGILLNLSFLWFLTEFFGLYYILSQIIGIGVATLWNFSGNKWWTWEK